MEKGKDKDTLNLTFILQVNNYFVVGNFSWATKSICPVQRRKEKKQQRKPVRCLLENCSFFYSYSFYVIYLFIYFYSIPQIYPGSYMDIHIYTHACIHIHPYIPTHCQLAIIYICTHMHVHTYIHISTPTRMSTMTFAHICNSTYNHTKGPLCHTYH